MHLRPTAARGSCVTFTMSGCSWRERRLIYGAYRVIVSWSLVISVVDGIGRHFWATLVMNFPFLPAHRWRGLQSALGGLEDCVSQL
jgi:hypothetical protein